LNLSGSRVSALCHFLPLSIHPVEGLLSGV
jgi:hypothetical protein